MSASNSIIILGKYDLINGQLAKNVEILAFDSHPVKAISNNTVGPKGIRPPYQITFISIVLVILIHFIS